MLHSFHSWVIFNWKCDWHDSVFEILVLPLEWRGCLNVQIQLECSLVCEAARAAGQWRQTGRETEVIWRDKTSSNMTCWSGSKHRRYSAEPTQEHRSLPPSSSPVSFLLSFSSPTVSISLYLFLSLSLSSHLCHSPPSVSNSLPLSLSISPPPSPHAVS